MSRQSSSCECCRVASGDRSSALEVLATGETDLKGQKLEVVDPIEEQSVDVPAPQVRQEKVVSLMPDERVHQRTVDLNIDGRCPNASDFARGCQGGEFDGK